MEVAQAKLVVIIIQVLLLWKRVLRVIKNFKVRENKSKEGTSCGGQLYIKIVIGKILYAYEVSYNLVFN